MFLFVLRVALPLAILVGIALQWWGARLVCYAGAACLLVWTVPMAPAMARLLTSERSDDALLFFLCLGLLGLTVIAGVRETWSWVRHTGTSSDMN